MSSMPNILGKRSVPVLAAANNTGSKVGEAQAGKTRTPILFLVDTSGSTGEGVNADLPEIQTMLDQMIQLLKQPPQSNHLAGNASVVDVAIVTYNTEPKLIQPFEQANKLANVPTLVANGGTNTATALMSCLDYVWKRMRYYDTAYAKAIPKAIPHIFHLTDGAPTDVVIGDEMWLAVQELMKEVSGDKTKPYSMISHFVSPNGMTDTHGHHVDASGQKLSGYNTLSRWTEGENVYGLKDAQGKFLDLAQVILKSVGGYSRQEGRINDLIKKYAINTLASQNPQSLFKKSGSGTGVPLR